MYAKPSSLDLDRALASAYRGWGISAEFEPRSVFHGDLAELLEDQSGIWNLQAHFTESTKSETVEVLQTKKYKRKETHGGFLEWWVSPTTMGFPTKNDHFGVWNGGTII